MPILNKVPISDPSGGRFDVIKESTPDAGVTIEGVLLKDGAITASSGSAIATNTISEVTSGSGVTIDGVLIKDNTLTARKEAIGTVSTRALTAAESGKIFDVAGASASNFTLPASAAGLNYTFICSVANNNAVTVVTSDTTDTTGEMLIGGVYFTEDTASTYLACGADDNKIVMDADLLNAGFSAGSWIKLIGLGSKKWFVQGQILTGLNSTGAEIFTDVD